MPLFSIGSDEKLLVVDLTKVDAQTPSYGLVFVELSDDEVAEYLQLLEKLDDWQKRFDDAYKQAWLVRLSGMTEAERQDLFKKPGYRWIRLWWQEHCREKTDAGDGSASSRGEAAVSGRPGAG